MHLIHHPQSSQLQQALTACLYLRAPWTGDVFRMAEAPYANANDFLTGEGAAKYGQRWNPPGIHTIYACLDPGLAMLEWETQRKKSGMPRRRHLPLTQITIIANLNAVLDLRLPPVVAALGPSLQAFISEAHKPQSDGAPELLAQAFGRLAAQMGVEALIVPAAPDPTRHNLVVYLPNFHSTSILKIHGEEHLPARRTSSP